MSSQNLFGTPDEQTALTESVKRAPRTGVQDAISPTTTTTITTYSLIYCTIYVCTTLTI